MIIVEEDGYSLMLTGVTQKEIDEFIKHLKIKTSYSEVVGISKFKFPKNDKHIDIFVIDCLNSRDGRREILDYWLGKGQKYDNNNINLLNI
ncbi:MAG: hypothetical protein K0R54_1858 [Clostridiaceae bacterium]|jgi:hypothetical protein|nr:hypothetical protein [Clostridiaceae bacterium]